MKKKLPRRSPPSDLKARLTKDGALEKATERSHRRQSEQPYGPHHSGILPIKIDFNDPDWLKNHIGAITPEAIAYFEQQAFQLADPIPPDEIRFTIDEDAICFRARRKTARDIYTQLGLAHDHLKKTYKKELGAKADWAPPKWLRNFTIGREPNKFSIWEHLQNYDFEEIYASLINNTLPQEKETWEIIKKAGGRTWDGDYPHRRGAIRDYILNPDWNRKELAERLSISIETLEKRRIKGFERIELLKPLPNRIGRGGKIIYSIGWERGFKDPETGESGRTGMILHLKDTREMRKALASFEPTKD